MEEIIDISKNLKMQLLNLKTARAKVLGLRSELESKRAEFEQSNKLLIESLSSAELDEDLSSSSVRELAIQEYNSTGDKKLYGGVGIRVTETLSYDSAAAFDWALSHKLCLTLDKKSFEKIAKSENISFVKKEDKVSATIPTDLGDLQ
jgi:hypothetical protein